VGILESTVPGGPFRLSPCDDAFSLCYLLVLIVTILVQPIVAPSATEALQLMNKSSLFAGPLQGLAAASLGVVFLRRNSEPEEPERECR
jgi:hypothetical protein